MSIHFCPKCGKILHVKKINEETIATCSNCGFQKRADHVQSSEKMKSGKKGKGVASEKNRLATFPHKCKKCGYEKAEVIDMGVWYSDESGVINYKCGKCGHTEREQGSNT